ncbi:hypothetical protein RhiirA5_498418 [Rhizophagus irregularis]|uniref:Uncharacterized protein n=1 Tax=Rhizophagus irregularis TaxID=588596 RepID=A0A2N0PUN1_9GLOM|nr:hypothetical protein RhiirA5_498418 [Rhizophagus irregularis]
MPVRPIPQGIWEVGTFRGDNRNISHMLICSICTTKTTTVTWLIWIFKRLGCYIEKRNHIGRIAKSNSLVKEAANNLILILTKFIQNGPTWEMMMATGNKRPRIREGSLGNLHFRSPNGIKRIHGDVELGYYSSFNKKILETSKFLLEDYEVFQGSLMTTKDIITLRNLDFSSDYSEEADNFYNPDNYIRTSDGCRQPKILMKRG